MKLMSLLKEIVDQSRYQSKYDVWELGLIKAWGHLLYLSYHNIPNSISNIVDEKTTKQVFEEYYRDADSDEDLRDWMSDEPPTMNRGMAVFDKNRLSQMMSSIANKTRLQDPLIVYRYEDTSHEQGWNSYTTDINDASYSGPDRSMVSYTIPKGYPVIFADRIADQGEVIINLSSSEKAEYINK